MAQVFHDRSVIRTLRIPAQDGTFDKALLSYSESTGESHLYVNYFIQNKVFIDLRLKCFSPYFFVLTTMVIA
jgi:hypothetical protein